MLDTLNDICADYGLTPVGIRHALDQYKKVIYELTNGRLSKLTYNGNFIISEAEDCFKKDYEEDHGWISVKDRLPIEKENPLTHDFAEVICFCDFGGDPRRTDIRMYKFGKPSWETKPHFWHGSQRMDGVITHWMPLPEPPKEDDND